MKYYNVFWNETQLVCGDGDGPIFQRFTKSIDILGHTLTHGIIQYEGGLTYRDQSGALSEHFCDAFGTLIKQWHLKQTVDEADWLIGKDIVTSNINHKAFRSMKSPGTAYDDSVTGKNPQPNHMSKYVNMDKYEDNGGVHVNCGIPNYAFYLIAIKLGGYAWEKIGKIWYITMAERLQRELDFYDMANITFEVAGDLFGVDSIEQKAVQNGWEEVGITKKV